MKLSTRLLFTVLPLVTSLQAAVPLTVNYQGTVYDSTGAAIGAATASNRKVIFRLYDAATAGTKLWTEEQTVTIYKGEFSVVLGNGTTATGTASTEIRPVLDTVFTSSNTTRYLEVMVDNGDNSITAADTPISPRQLITTTFYAFHAQVADGIASSSDLTINPVTGTATNYGLGWYGTGRLWGTTAVDGPVLYGNAGGALGSNASGTKNIALLWNATGQVGIGATGTFTTNNKLTLQGDDTTTAAKQLIIRGQTDSNEALYLGFDTTNNRATLQSYTSVSTPTAGPLLLNPSGGNIGVGTGTVAPVAKLTVEGSVSATGTGGHVFGTGGDADGGLFSPADGVVTLATNGSERLRIDSTGNVGVGTVTPTYKLDVSGNAHVTTTLTVDGAASAASFSGNGASLTALAGTNLSTGPVPLAALVDAVKQALCPAGSMMPYGGSTAPSGWLLCDGSSYSQTTYPNLYAAIGNAFGTTSGNFNVPDLKGRFLRGMDSGTTRDFDSASRTAIMTGGNIGARVGSLQADTFKTHTHPYKDIYHAESGGTITVDANRGANGTDYDNKGFEIARTSDATGGTETRPVNVNVNYIIKY